MSFKPPQHEIANAPTPVSKVYTTKHAPTLQAFHNSDAFVRGVMGPFGSGKSTAMTMEILTRAMEQAPSPIDGKRYTRWAIVRNSYPELKTTTIKTWGDWCPPQYGRLTMGSPIRHYLVTNDMDMEVLFLALDRPEDQKKLLSLELTGAWFNEAREIPKAIIDAMTGRVGRYPSVSMGGCTWSGIFMDTNPPDDQCWWYQMAEEDTPEGWEFFQQPPGDSDEAENLPNLPKNYYGRIAAGKDPDWVKVYVKGQYGYVREGKPVFSSFRDRVHVSPEIIAPIPNLPLFLGADFGLTPACGIAQRTISGRWVFLDEFCMEDAGVKRFAEQLAMYLAQHYAEFPVAGGWGDPAGKERGYREESAFDLMNEYCPLDPAHPEVRWLPAPTNDPLMRLEAIRNGLDRLVDGDPGILVSPKCRTTRKGFNGGYHYKYLRSGDGSQTQETPNKNKFSHIMDAWQYAVLGGGEHNIALRKVARHRGVRRRGQSMIAKDLNYKIFG